MSAQFYKFLHIAGILFLFLAYGGVILNNILGKSKEENPFHKALVATHGVSLLVIFVAGFGLLAKMGTAGPATWPWWVYVKMVIWFALGGLIAALGKKNGLGVPMFFVVPALGLVAAWLGLMWTTLG